MRRALFGLLPLSLLALSACAGASRTQKVQEAAYELNMGTRFGRMPLEKVAASSREKFVAQHKAWQGPIRIVDVDLAGMSVPKSGDATVFIQVGWQRADEQDMRMSVLAQKWREERDGWMLASESVADGDPTIFDAVRPSSQAAGTTAPPSRYQTTVIRLASSREEGRHRVTDSPSLTPRAKILKTSRRSSSRQPSSPGS